MQYPDNRIGLWVKTKWEKYLVKKSYGGAK